MVVGKRFQWNMHQNVTICIHEKWFENVVSKMATMLYRICFIWAISMISLHWHEVSQSSIISYTSTHSIERSNIQVNHFNAVNDATYRHHGRTTWSVYFGVFQGNDKSRLHRKDPENGGGGDVEQNMKTIIIDTEITILIWLRHSRLWYICMSISIWINPILFGWLYMYEYINMD